MWEEILRLAVGNGLWAVLFCALLIYELKDSRRREVKYQGMLRDLTGRLKVVEDIREDTQYLVGENKAKKRKKPDKAANAEAVAKGEAA